LCPQVKTCDLLAANSPKTGQTTGQNAHQAQAKKNPNERFGFNPPKEEVEETAELQNFCNDGSNYMSRPCATQENLHYEIRFHNVTELDVGGVFGKTPFGSITNSHSTQIASDIS
jgi:hypothetical protein